MPRSFLVKKKEKGNARSCNGLPSDDLTQQDPFDLSVNSTSENMYECEVQNQLHGSTNCGELLDVLVGMNQKTMHPMIPQSDVHEVRQSYDVCSGPLQSMDGDTALNLVKKGNGSDSFQASDHPSTRSVTPFTIEVLAVSSRKDEKVQIISEVGINRVKKYQELTDESTVASAKLPSPPMPADRVSGTPNTSTVSYTYDAFFVTDGRSKKRKEYGISKKPKSQYTCNQCGKQYATSSNLSRHKQTHRSLDSQQAKKCPHCNKVYVSMPALSMHILTHELRHQCTVCNKSFSRPWLLQGHMRSHTGEKPYGCAHCGKTFADRSNLRAHMQTHSGCKHFECQRCNKTFALKSYLNKHCESACLKEQFVSGRPDTSYVGLETL